MGTRVFWPEAIYHEVRGFAPDLIIYFGDLNWRSVGSIGGKTLYTFENDTGPDDANHAQYGIFILYDPRQAGGGRYIDTMSIYDVAPTLLHLLDMQAPSSMIGKVRDLWT
jgi:predicted AlkP superfamily phosphohydrolase/phosphomutase